MVRLGVDSPQSDCVIFNCGIYMTQAIFFEGRLEDNYLGHQIKEIYFDKVYEPYLLGKKNLTIVDIGANIGMTSYYFSQFADKVYAIEPSLEHYTTLTNMLAFNKIENVKPINRAIYIKSGQFPFFHNKNKTMRSLHMAVDDKSEEAEIVNCVTLEELINQEKIEHIDLLKVDIEGSEVEVFSHTSFKNIASKVDTIVTERHGWSGRNPQQLIDALKSVDFQVEIIPNQADLIIAKRI